MSRAEVYDPTTNSWSAAAAMTNGRLYHTATLLPNGKVLVAGGYSYYYGYLASAELYDPTTNSWSSAGSMTDARYYHTATALPDGRVLIAGGYNYSGILASAELYDPATNSWSPAGSMTNARQEHTATALLDGKILVVGGKGNSGNLDSAELYDPATNSWSTAAYMPAPNYQPTETLLSNGKVLILGGSLGNRARLYDPATDSWSPAASMAVSRYAPTATQLSDGEVLVVGGAAAGVPDEIYDPTNPTPTSTPTLPPTQTATATPTSSPSETPTSTPVDTPTQSATVTPTQTATSTPSATPTPTLAAGCPDVPSNTCFTAGKGSLAFMDNAALKRNFSWKWTNGTAALGQTDFGDPVSGGTSYTLCVYDQTAGVPALKMGAAIAPAGACVRGRACWKAVSHTGWLYRNTAGNTDSITQVLVQGGKAGQPKLQIAGKGPNVSPPRNTTEYFDQDPTVIVQLYSSAPANCWSSSFDGLSTKKNDGLQFKALIR